MFKKMFFYACLISILAFLISGLEASKVENLKWFQTDNDWSVYAFPSVEKKDYQFKTIPFTGRFFVGYKEAIAFKESQGKYKKVNTYGYVGKYQFGGEALKDIGVKNRRKFLNNPKLQEKAFIALLSKNKWQLKKEIVAYEGKIIGGVRITESGLLAAAHLGGVNSVKKFLQSNGNKKCKDRFGTSIKKYLKDFGGYETTGIIANKNARVL